MHPIIAVIIVALGIYAVMLLSLYIAEHTE